MSNIVIDQFTRNIEENFNNIIKKTIDQFKTTLEEVQKRVVDKDLAKIKELLQNMKKNQASIDKWNSSKDDNLKKVKDEVLKEKNDWE